ncbi:hypothetical protein BDW74DRAFT_189747 [Aspergillus multicolor]|uniref:MBL fold metallo-hydrolase n=1 Tax=Aspergillus multicolor TaxID=41759 RepID=UPI003CCD5BE4
MQQITIDPNHLHAPTRDSGADHVPQTLPPVKNSKAHPKNPRGENASIYFVGNATTIIEWQGVRILTDPNFLHAGDHVHLGPGVTSTRLHDPAVKLLELPRIDLVLLSHYHEDHFDRKVEASLRRDLPIVTTSHAKSVLTSAAKGADAFTNVYYVDPFHQMMIDIASRKGESNAPALRVTGMPGKHVPLGKPMEVVNEIIGAFPPVNGWMLELGYKQGQTEDSSFTTGYRIYISGDTLLVDELKEIPRLYGEHNINLMIVHLGATMVPSPSLMPFTLMVTMNAEQSVELMQLVKPDITIPVHFDDYDVMSESLEQFKDAVETAGLGGGVVYLDRGEEYRFCVRC